MGRADGQEDARVAGDQYLVKRTRVTAVTEEIVTNDEIEGTHLKNPHIVDRATMSRESQVQRSYLGVN